VTQQACCRVISGDCNTFADNLAAQSSTASMKQVKSSRSADFA
jgi:hypothetical protein